MDDQAIRQRLADVEARLSAIERRLSGVAWGQEPPVHTKAAVPPMAPAPPTAPLSVSVPTPAASPAPAIARHEGLERFLGVKVAAWVGGIIVIAAIAVFARYVIEQGWLGLLPPSIKLALAYALSGAFVVAGSVLRDRIGRFPSAALQAAGLGGLYVATCAGVTPFDVFGPTAALLAGVAVAAVGGLVTYRSSEPVVGGISLIGAYVVPVFMGWNRPEVLGLPGQLVTACAALTAAYAIALVLARVGPPSFAGFRHAGVLQALSGVQLCMATGWQPSVTMASFVFLWWAMAVGECSYAAVQGRLRTLNLAYSVGATLVAAPIAVHGVRNAFPWSDVHAWIPLVMAAACAGAAVPLRALVPVGGIDARDAEEDPAAAAMVAAASQQTKVLAALCGALVLVQVGILVRGDALPAAWAVLGVVAIHLGRSSRTPVLAGLGFASMVLAVLATAAFKFLPMLGVPGAVVWQHPPAGSGERSMWAIRVDTSMWSPVVVAFALLFAARAWSMGSDPSGRPRAGSVFLAGCAAIAWTLLSLWACDRYASMAALLAVPVAAVLAGRTHALVKLVSMTWALIAACGWYVVTLVEATGIDGPAARPSGGMVLAALVCAAFLLVSRRYRAERFGQVPAAAALGFGLAAVATLLVIESNLRGDDVGSERFGTALAAAVTGAVATVCTVWAHRARMDLVESVGQVGVGLAACAALYVAVAEAVSPTPGVTWAGHWILSASTVAALVLAGCAWALRAFASRAMSGLFALAAVAFTSCVVVKFFEPAVSPPFASSVAIQRVALSAWVALVAVGLVIAGFRGADVRMRWTGLGLLGAAAVKVLVLDMSGAEPAWRVVALMVTGILLVVTSVVYSRAGRAAG